LIIWPFSVIVNGRKRLIRQKDFNKKYLYSWKLELGDPLRQGKRKCKSLREKEREVQRNIDDGTVPYGGQLTVLALMKKYILQKSLYTMSRSKCLPLADGAGYK
jgi:hypothetical protein